MIWRAVLVLAGLAVAVVVSAGRPLGEDIFHNASPPCVTCHNAQRGNLAYSRMSPSQMERTIRGGVADRMPGYNLKRDQMDALIAYLLTLREEAR